MRIAEVTPMTKKPPNPIDKHVDSRVRTSRLMLSMSQEKLGDALGLTFQQVQKYEKGANRVSASRLQQISEILRVPVPFFFEGALNYVGAPSKASQEPSTPAHITDLLATSDGLALIEAFAQVTDKKLRRRIVDLIEQIVAR